MATVNFLYRSTKDKANLSLRLLYRFNEIDFSFAANTKLNVTKEYWNKHHKAKMINDIDLKNEQHRVNIELNKIENYILDAYDRVNADEVNKDWLALQVDHYYNPPTPAESLPLELIKYIEYYIEVKRNEVTNSTTQKSGVIKQLLIRYQIQFKKILLITDIDSQFKTHFENYCRSNAYAPNTIARAIRFVKTICKHAKSHGLDTNFQLDNIKIKYQKTDSIYLTEDELEAIIKAKDLTEYLDNARDWLLISCYTGQRVSDFMRFTKNMIRYERNKEGVLKALIEFTQKKTGKVMTIPLSAKVTDILSKRNGEFPRPISDQKYNDYIKLVCREAKIIQMIQGTRKSETEKDSKIYRNETGMFEKCDLVSSHIGRRSFATNNYGSIPTSFLIHMTGHSSEVMFLNYIGKSNKDIAMELTNYF